MATEPDYSPTRMVVFPPCGGCRKERWEEQEREQKRRNPLYVARPFVDQTKEHVPCRRHCSACHALPKDSEGRPQECMRHWREGTGGSNTLSDAFAARVAARTHNADHGTAIGMSAPTGHHQAVTFSHPRASTDTLDQIRTAGRLMFPSGPLPP